MNDRMKKLFEECRQLAKDKNIQVVLPSSTNHPTIMHGGIEYIDGGTVKASVIKGRAGAGTFQYKFNPNSPMGKLKEMGVPHSAFQEFRLGAVAGLVNHGIPVDEQMQSLVERIDAANGNWIKFIHTPSEVSPTYTEYFELYLTKAVYNTLAKNYSPTMAFRLTLGVAENIKALAEKYFEKSKTQSELVGSGVYILYGTVKDLVVHILTDEPFNPDELTFMIIPGSEIKLS